MAQSLVDSQSSNRYVSADYKLFYDSPSAWRAMRRFNLAIPFSCACLGFKLCFFFGHGERREREKRTGETGASKWKTKIKSPTRLVIHNNELRSHERHEQWRLSGGGGEPGRLFDRWGECDRTGGDFGESFREIFEVDWWTRMRAFLVNWHWGFGLYEWILQEFGLWILSLWGFSWISSTFIKVLKLKWQISFKLSRFLH